MLHGAMITGFAAVEPSQKARPSASRKRRSAAARSGLREPSGARRGRQAGGGMAARPPRRPASRRRPCASAGRRTRRRRCPGTCRARARRRGAGRARACRVARRAGARGRWDRPRRRASTPSRRRRSLERHLEVGEQGRVDLLVDDDARRRVRDVDERDAALGVASRAPRAPLCVMSRSWVFRSVVTWNSRTGGYPTRPMATRPRERPRRLPRRGRPLHRGAGRGVLPPLRGPKETLRARADLRALLRSDDTRRRPAPRRARRDRAAPARSSSGASPARATSAT